MEFVLNNWELIALAITVVVAVTPTEKDNNIWSRVKNVLGAYVSKVKKK